MNEAVSGLNISVDNIKIVYTRDGSDYQNSNYRRLDSRVFIYDVTKNTPTELDRGKENGFNSLEVKF